MIGLGGITVGRYGLSGEATVPRLQSSPVQQ